VSLVASRLRAATRPHFGPIVDRGAVPAAQRAAVVDARVCLAVGGRAVAAVRPVARHIRLDTGLGARQGVGTRLPAGPGSAAVLPVGVLDLIGTAAQRTNVHDAADVSVAVRFHLTNALHASICELSRTTRALRGLAEVEISACGPSPAAVRETEELVADAAERTGLLVAEVAIALTRVGRPDYRTAR